MAKTTPGPLVGSISGAVGGVTFRGAGASASVQGRACKRGPATASQDKHRAFLGSASAAWIALSDAERLSWDTAAAQHFVRPTVSDAAAPSGRACFLSWYMHALYCRVAPSLTWPQYPLVYRQLPYTVTASRTPATSLRVAVSLGIPGTAAAVWLARARTSDRFNARPAWRLLYGEPADPALVWTVTPPPPTFVSTVNLSTYFAARFPDAVSGGIWQMRLYLMTVGNIAVQPTLALFTVA